MSALALALVVVCSSAFGVIVGTLLALWLLVTLTAPPRKD